MTRKFLYLFFLPVCLASCSSQHTHWVSRTELFPASNADIKSVKLVDGSVIEFNQSLGWYNPEKQLIEGVTITGWHDTTALAKIQQVEIQDVDANAGGNVLKVVGIMLLAGGIILVIVMLNYFSTHGGQACLVLIAAVGLTTTGAALLIFA